MAIEYEGCKRGQRRDTSQQQQASGQEEAADWERAAAVDLEAAAAVDLEEAADWEGGGGKHQKRTTMLTGRRVDRLCPSKEKRVLST